MNTPNDASDTQINRLLDHDTPDTAPNWDGTADGSDPLEIDEAIAIVKLQAAYAAKVGNYGTAEDLLEVGKLLERIAEAQS